MSNTENKISMPKVIDFANGVTTFETDEHKYTVYLDSISIDRWGTLQQKEAETLGYYSLVKPLDFQNELIKAFNEQNYAYLGKLLYDKQYYYHFDQKKINPILEYCAVFIYREDEDTAIYDPKIAKEKIADWKKSNLDMISFFTLSVKASPTLSKAYSNYIQTTMEKGQKTNQKK